MIGQGLVPAPPVAVFGAAGSLAAQLDACTYVTTFRPDWDRLAANGQSVALTPPAGLGTAIVCVARNRVETFGRIASALRALVPGGVLVVDGQKSDGIDSILKTFGKVIAWDGSDARAHGKIAWAVRPDTLPPDVAHWADAAAPRVNAAGYLTAPGMFSADRIDPATAFLADHLPQDATGPAADLGAGWGALSAALLARAAGVEHCDLVEADHAAAEAARHNVTDPRARVHWADATRWPGSGYRLIVSNPPFHVSRAADPSLGQAFISAASAMLHPKGRLLIVANRQLPYEKTADVHFRRRELLAQTERFKVLDLTQPRQARQRTST